MLRTVLALVLAATTAAAAPKVGEHVGGLGPGGADQAPAFLLTDEYRADFGSAQKCALTSIDNEPVYIGQKAVYVDDKKQGGIVVLLDEYARRYALDYCWK
jgi:hypothetical protein